MKKDRTLKDLSAFEYTERISFNEDSPIYGTAAEVEEFSKIIYKSLDQIKNSTSIRHIVIETWLVIDFFVRDSLAKAFNFKAYTSEDIDLRYEILPISFVNCLDTFESLLKSQRSLPNKPHEEFIMLNANFLRFLREEHKEFYKDLAEVIRLYELKINSENSDHTLTTEVKNQKYRVNRMWVESLSLLDKNWFKLARRINKIRNYPAHSYNSESILNAFGFTGKDAFKQAKTECIENINKMLSVTIDKQINSIETI